MFDEVWKDGVLVSRTTRAATEDDVKNEARRRLEAAFGARPGDQAHLDQLIANGTREAVKLLSLGRDSWSPAQSARAAQLQAADDYVDAVGKASKALRAFDQIPADFADDRHWPAFPAA